MSGKEKKPSRAIRIIATVLMGLTATFTLLGGAGTSCVALAAEKWESMAALVPYKPLYQVLVVITIADAIAGIWVTVGLARGRKRYYGAALATLIVGALAAGVQMYASLRLRGGAAPTNIRLYLTLFTLLVFLLFRLPPIWRKSGLDGSSADSGSIGTSAGLAAFLGGAVVTTTFLWAGPSHTFDGYNWVNVWLVPLTIVGGLLMAAGIILLALSGKSAQPATQTAERTPNQQVVSS